MAGKIKDDGVAALVRGLSRGMNGVCVITAREEVDERLRGIMASIHVHCVEAAQRFGVEGNYVHGANIAGFVKVADAMIDQGVV